MISVSVSLPACLAMVTLCLYAPVFILFLCLFTVPTTVYAAFAVGLCMHFLQISVSLVVTLLY